MMSPSVSLRIEPIQCSWLARTVQVQVFLSLDIGSNCRRTSGKTSSGAAAKFVSPFDRIFLRDLRGEVVVLGQENRLHVRGTTKQRYIAKSEKGGTLRGQG